MTHNRQSIFEVLYVIIHHGLFYKLTDDGSRQQNLHRRGIQTNSRQNFCPKPFTVSWLVALSGVTSLAIYLAKIFRNWSYALDTHGKTAFFAGKSSFSFLAHNFDRSSLRIYRRSSTGRWKQKDRSVNIHLSENNQFFLIIFTLFCKTWNSVRNAPTCAF